MSVGEGAPMRRGLKRCYSTLSRRKPRFLGRRRCPDAKGIETVQVLAFRRQGVDLVGEGAPMRRGLKQTRNADWSLSNAYVGEGAPMRRGLKQGLNCCRPLSARVGEGAPMRRGLKRCGGCDRPDETTPRRRRCPDAKGIETHARGASACQVYFFCWRRCPDAKGIETCRVANDPDTFPRRREGQTSGRTCRTGSTSRDGATSNTRKPFSQMESLSMNPVGATRLSGNGW